MDIHLVINNSTRNLSDTLFFTEAANAHAYLNKNQKKLAFKTSLLSMETIKVDATQIPEALYVVKSRVSDGTIFNALRGCQIKGCEKIEGFYANSQAAQMAAEQLAKPHGKIAYEIDFYPIEEMKAKMREEAMIAAEKQKLNKKISIPALTTGVVGSKSQKI